MLDELANVILDPRRGHVPVELVPIAQARTLYRHAQTPALGATSAHGWRIASSTAAGPEATACAPSSRIGWADRYGGHGIGRNGGSGRNVILGKVQLKGVGRTPLVDPETPLSHASGGAYLEECIREAIFSGIVAHDFPYGAIPTLEIVDTGETQRWPAPVNPSQERRVLFVRPLFVRPAHFERAVAFDAAGTFDGERDHARVTSIWRQTAALLGPQALVKLFDGCWRRWAHQLAYGFVHRLSHGNNTSSNIAIDGRLLDFGAASALPSWANTATSYFHDPIDRRFNAIAQAMRSVSYYLGTHLGWEWARPQRLEKSLHACAEAFRQALVFETLRLCGLPDDVAIEVLTGPRRLMALATVGAVISEAQAERLDLLEPAPLGRVDWPMSRLWCGRPPACLDALRRLMNSLVGKGLRTDCEERHRHRSATRSELFKPHLRQDIFRLIGEDLDTRLKTDPSFIQRWIDDHIARHVLEFSPAAQDASRLLLPFSDAGD